MEKIFGKPQRTQKAQRNQGLWEERGRRAGGKLQERGENRCADRNAIGERIERDNLDNSGQLVQGAPPERAAGEGLSGGAGLRQFDGCLEEAVPGGVGVGNVRHVIPLGGFAKGGRAKNPDIGKEGFS